MMTPEDRAQVQKEVDEIFDRILKTPDGVNREFVNIKVDLQLAGEEALFWHLANAFVKRGMDPEGLVKTIFLLGMHQMKHLVFESADYNKIKL